MTKCKWLYKSFFIFSSLISDIVSFCLLGSHILRGHRGDLQIQYCLSHRGKKINKKKENHLLLLLFWSFCASFWRVQTSFLVKRWFCSSPCCSWVCEQSLPVARIAPPTSKRTKENICPKAWQQNGHTTVAKSPLLSETGWKVLSKCVFLALPAHDFRAWAAVQSCSGNRLHSLTHTRTRTHTLLANLITLDLVS